MTLHLNNPQLCECVIVINIAMLVMFLHHTVFYVVLGRSLQLERKQQNQNLKEDVVPEWVKYGTVTQETGVWNMLLYCLFIIFT